MGRIIITILLLTFAFGVGAQEQQPILTKQQVIQQQQVQQEMDAGQWVQESWKKGDVQKRIKANISKDQKSRCERKLEYYNKKLEKKPTSSYYKKKLKKWTKRCTK